LNPVKLHNTYANRNPTARESLTKKWQNILFPFSFASHQIINPSGKYDIPNYKILKACVNFALFSKLDHNTRMSTPKSYTHYDRYKYLDKIIHLSSLSRKTEFQSSAPANQYQRLAR
jgi:hypothetical protein